MVLQQNLCHTPECNRSALHTPQPLCQLVTTFGVSGCHAPHTWTFPSQWRQHGTSILLFFSRRDKLKDCENNSLFHCSILPLLTLCASVSRGFLTATKARFQKPSSHCTCRYLNSCGIPFKTFYVALLLERERCVRRRSSHGVVALGRPDLVCSSLCQFLIISWTALLLPLCQWQVYLFWHFPCKNYHQAV